jgi:PAS domain S-box-containing protein
MDQSPEQQVKSQVLAGGGETGALMRALDWSTTPLGAVMDWPQSLRTAVSICLHSRFELFIWWGPELTMVYNDAYRQTLASKHPWALGKPGRIVWSEIWSIIGPMLQHVVDTGEATWSDDLRLILERHGYPEETYHTFSYSPILDESGGVGGVFTAVSQTTEKVIGERRLRTLRDLAARSADTKSEEEAWRVAAEVIGENNFDVAFTALYRLENDGHRLTSRARSGIADQHPCCPCEIELRSDHSLAGYLRTAVSEGRPVEIDDAGSLGFPLPGGFWEVEPKQLIVVPLLQIGQWQPLGVLVAGVSRMKLLDESYRTFFSLMGGQIAKSVADAQAFENERRRAEALAELDRAKTAFFSNVSHEFRTPLTLMLGPLEDTLANADLRLSPADRRQLTVVHRNGLRLLKLVNTLLDFSRIEAGRMKAVFEPTDIAGTTEELASVFRSAVERAGMTLTVNCDRITEPVYLDRDMWEKVVLNLMSNAFKFTFEGGITVNVRDANKSVELSITDTGTGIPENELPRLFERFHRVAGAKGRSYEGTGIGLALVQELVKLHGGAVSVESEFGQGTTFRVSIPKGKDHLPADQVESGNRGISTALRAESYVDEALQWLPEIGEVGTASGTTQAALSFAEHRADGRILLADDNADMREYVKHLLEQRYEVIAVSNGQEALEIASARNPDLILSDVMMPVLDGFGLLRAVRQNGKIAGTPIILLSARAGEESRVEGLEAGADDYLVKPFTARELMARVGAHLAMLKMRRDAASTEAKLRAEAELERKRLKELFVNAPAAIAMTSGPDHTLLFINPPYLKLLGRPGDHRNYVGIPLRDVVPEIVEQGISDLLDRVYRTGQAFVATEWKAHLKRSEIGQPETGYFNFVLQPSRDVNGKAEGILIHVMEVTDQVVARQEVERRERLLKIAQRAAHAGSFEWNLETMESQWSDEFFEVHGISRDRPPSYSEWKRLVFAEDLHRFESRLASAIANRNDTLVTEYRTAAEDGSQRWIAQHGRLFYDGSGKLVRMVGIVMDVTQRKLAEDALRRSEKLAAAGRLAASIAHEINNPLEAITNLLYLANSDIAPESAKSYIDMAQKELARVSNIATQTLRFYRQTTAPTPTKISDLMESVLNMYHNRLYSANIRVVRDYRPAPEIKCLPGEIRQVLANLVGNSLDAMSKGGKLHLRIRGTNHGSGVQVTVADTGSGIPSGVLPHIFEPFVTTKESTGTGLGLWVSSEIVQKHSGTIKVRSRREHGKNGTVFTIYFPSNAFPVSSAAEGAA